MVDVIKRVEQAIIEHHLLKAGDRVLVAYSGGPDSMALLHILMALEAKFDIELSAAYLDHSIRKESAKEREFCRTICHDLGVKFYSRKVDIPALARRRKLSIEETGREARYAYFKSLAQKHGITKIATGHTLDDNVETVILNITRGCGLDGLAGIPRIRGRIIRPLLDLEKRDILKWLGAQGIGFINDKSNRSLVYSRNRIRVKVLPELEKINPAIKRNVARLSEIVSEELEFSAGRAVSAYMDSLVESGKGKIVLDLGKLVLYDKSLKKKALNEAISNLRDHKGNLSAQTISRALSVVEGASGKKATLGQGIVIENSQGRIALLKESSRPEETRLKIPGRTELSTGRGYIDARIIEKKEAGGFDPENRNVFLDFEKTTDITARYWRKGDKIRPLGMKGHKRLSDIFIDRKVPEFERKMVPLIFSGKELAWVVGLMISDDFKITDSTQKALNLHYADFDN